MSTNPNNSNHIKSGSGKNIKPKNNYEGNRGFETPPRTSSAPPNLAEQQEMFNQYPRYPPYNNYYSTPQYYQPQQFVYPPFMTPQHAPIKVNVVNPPERKKKPLTIRDPSGKPISAEELLQDVQISQQNTKEENKPNEEIIKEEKISRPGIPEELPKGENTKEIPQESQPSESETNIQEESTNNEKSEEALADQETLSGNEVDQTISKEGTEEIKENLPEDLKKEKDDQTKNESNVEEKKVDLPDDLKKEDTESESEDIERESSDEEDEWENAEIQVDQTADSDKKGRKITYSREELLKFEIMSQPTESTRKASEENDLSRSTKDDRRNEYSRGKGHQKRDGKKSPFQQKKTPRNEGSLSRYKRPTENRWKRPTGHEDIKLPIRGILNKLTPTLYDSLLEKLLEIKLEDFEAYRVLVELIYEKAIKDTKFTEIYARLCKDLNSRFGSLKLGDKETKFRVLIINKCANEFETRESPESIPETITDPVDREEKINKMKDNLNGMMIFIGELYKHRMIGGKHMINCLSELINKNTQYELEIFSSLYKTLGEKVESEQKHQVMLAEVHKKMEHISKSKDFPPRTRFMFLDLLDLKKNNFAEKKRL